MGLVWDDKYSTGDEEIDKQHMQLFTYLDDLEQHIKDGASEKYVKGFLNALGLYTRSHFCYEEICMRKNQCPVAEKNKVQHAKLLKAFSDAQQRFDIEGVSDELLMQLRNFPTSWLVNHIMKIDVHLKACVKK